MHIFFILYQDLKDHYQYVFSCITERQTKVNSLKPFGGVGFPYPKCGIRKEGEV